LGIPPGKDDGQRREKKKKNKEEKREEKMGPPIILKMLEKKRAKRSSGRSGQGARPFSTAKTTERRPRYALGKGNAINEFEPSQVLPRKPAQKPRIGGPKNFSVRGQKPGGGKRARNGTKVTTPP